jgi:hypothetical protein
MPEQTNNTQKDSSRAADERPVPSQAEGDLETVEQDLAEKEKAKSTSTSTGSR